MKWFTEEWNFGDVPTQVAVDAYQAHLGEISPKLPQPVLTLARGVNIHDGELSRLVLRREDAVLELGLRCGDGLDGWYDLHLEYQSLAFDEIDLASLRQLGSGRATALYDEVDLSPDGHIVHRILFFQNQDWSPEISIAFEALGLRLEPGEEEWRPPVPVVAGL